MISVFLLSRCKVLLLLFITPFFDTSVRSLAGEPNFSLKAARV